MNTGFLRRQLGRLQSRGMRLDSVRRFFDAARNKLREVAEYENRFYPLKLAIYGTKVATGRVKFRPKHAGLVLLGRMSPTRLIPHMLFQVSAPCQHSCQHCAHSALIDHNPGYQLSMEDLNHFLDCTRGSNYYIENLWIDGPGEPTLWRHLNEGVERLYQSGLVASINLTTNGQSLERVRESTWRCFGRVLVTLYPSSKTTSMDALRDTQRTYGFILRVQTLDKFRKKLVAPDADSLPAFCACPGPMIYGRRVFLDCGPTGVEAGRLMGQRELEDPRYCRDLTKDYLEGVRTEVMFGTYPRKRVHLELCTYCWANFRIQLESVAHEQGRHRTADGGVPPLPPPAGCGAAGSL